MWNCKHCGNAFEYTRITEKANHSRWCSKNPNRGDTENSKIARQAYLSDKFGEYKIFQVECGTCKNIFDVKEREKSFPSKEIYYCNRSCANSVGGKVKALKYHTDENAHYTTIAWRHHKKECVVCGEQNIVAVHHYNEIHADNRPENLVPLCPTHHQYIHSKYKHLVENIVENYVVNFTGGVV